MNNKSTDIINKAADLIDSTNNAARTVENTAQAITASANAVVNIAENMDNQDSKFIDKHKSPAGYYRNQVLEDLIKDDSISKEDKLKFINECQTADSRERKELIEERIAVNKAQGLKALEIGGGILAGAGGFALIINTIKSIIDSNNKSA